MSRYKDPFSPKIKYNLDQITQIMENALSEFITDNTFISYWDVLNKHGLTRSYLKHWLTGGSYPELIDIMEEFGFVQQNRLITKGLDGTYNANFAKFILESSHSYMRQSDRLKIEQNDRAIDYNKPISIGFTDFEEVEDDED